MLHFRVDFIVPGIPAFLRCHVLGHVFHTPHAFVNFVAFEIFGIFSNTIVRQMLVSIRAVIRVLRTRCKSYLSLAEVPYGQRVPVGHHHPLPDVKFSLEYYEGVLDVLHAYELTFFLFEIRKNFYHRLKHTYSPSARQARRFDDPNV